MAQIIHKVKPGETVVSICLQFKLSWDRFVLLNPDFDEFGIRYASQELTPGERLVVGITDPLKHIRR